MARPCRMMDIRQSTYHWVNHALIAETLTRKMRETIHKFWRRRFAILFFLTAVGFGYLCLTTIVGYEQALLMAQSEHGSRRAEMDQQQVQIDLLIKKEVEKRRQIERLQASIEQLKKENSELRIELDKKQDKPKKRRP